MGKNEELKQLFEEWKEKQKEEKYNADTISLQRVDKSSFGFDGFVFNEKEGGVLYILKESHLENANKIIPDNRFWFKEIYKAENNNSKISKRIEKMQKSISEKIDSIGKEDLSFMNINKRGGFSSSDNKVLLNYYNEYEEFILKEIKIINPRIVVVCIVSKDKESQEIYSKLKESLKELNKKQEINCERVIEMPHPSYISISTNEYIEIFEQNYDDENCKIK